MLFRSVNGLRHLTLAPQWSSHRHTRTLTPTALLLPPSPRHQSDKWHASRRAINRHWSSVWQPCNPPTLHPSTLHHCSGTSSACSSLRMQPHSRLHGAVHEEGGGVDWKGKQWKTKCGDAFYLSICIILGQCGSMLGALVCVFTWMHDSALKNGYHTTEAHLGEAREKVVSVFPSRSVSSCHLILSARVGVNSWWRVSRFDH